MDKYTPIEVFYKNIELLLGAYWPDWSGQFHIAFPTAVDSEVLVDEFITARVISKEPMKTDTNYGRTVAPSTKFPVRGLVPPMLIRTTADTNTHDMYEEYTQTYDCIIRFDIFAKENYQAIRLANNFERFMRETAHHHRGTGVGKITFLHYSEDVQPTLKYGESYRNCYFNYFINYKDVWTVRVPRIKEIQLHLLADGQMKRLMDSNLPLEDLPYHHITKITGGPESIKIPE